MTAIEKKEQRYNVRLIATQDDTPVRGNAIASDDDALDKKYEDMILERLADGDVWAWAQVEVQATLPDGRMGSAYLGGCSYNNEDEFKRGSGYYEDLIDEAIESAEAQYPAVDTQRKFIEDLLSFVAYVHRNTDMEDSKKLSLLVTTLMHDLSGTLDGDEFFSPRVSGYSDKFPLI